MPVDSIPYFMNKIDVDKSGYDYGILVYFKKSKYQVQAFEMASQTGESLSIQENDKIETSMDSERSYLGNSLKDIGFWLNSLHFSILQLRNYFYLSTVADNLMNYVNKDQTSCGNEGVSFEDIDFYMIVFGICQFFAFFSAPLNGFMVDKLTRKFSLKLDSKKAKLRALACSTMTTCVVAVLFSVFVMIPSLNVQFVSFVLQVVFRSFLYGGCSNFIAVSYPSEHFGKLYGINQTIASLFLIFQLPINRWVTYNLKNCFTQVNKLFIVVSLSTIVHPIFLFVKSKR